MTAQKTLLVHANHATQNAAQASELEFSDQDIFEAMRELPDYLDISTEDFRALYHCAYRHAQTRVTPPAAPPQAPQTLEPPRVAAVQLFRAWIGSLIGIALVFLLLFLARPLAAVFAEALRKGFGAYIDALRKKRS